MLGRGDGVEACGPVTSVPWLLAAWSKLFRYGALQEQCRHLAGMLLSGAYRVVHDR